MTIERRALADTPHTVMIDTPSGQQSAIALAKVDAGLWRGTAKAEEIGLYRLSEGALYTVAASGPLNPKEVSDMRASDALLTPYATATGGSVRWLADGGVPSIRRVAPGTRAAGDNWIGLRANGTYRVTSIVQDALLPPWLGVLLVLGALLLAWRAEGR
jgi:hypothetical protein